MDPKDLSSLTVIKKASIQCAATPVEPESVLSLTTKTPAQRATLELDLVEEDAPKTPIRVETQIMTYELCVTS